MRRKLRFMALLLLLLWIMLLACNGSGSEDGCPSIVIDCPGTADDFVLCSNCRLKDQWIEDGVRHYRWYYCGLRSKITGGAISANCKVSEN